MIADLKGITNNTNKIIIPAVSHTNDYQGCPESGFQNISS